MIARILIVRHGETRHNVDGIAQGWSDSELSARGRAQVESLARRAAGLGVTAIYSSSLPRARATAEAVSRATGLAVLELDDLREMNCGRWEGESFLAVRQREAEFFARWVADPSLACPEGESFVDVRGRLERAFAEIEKRENGTKAVPLIVSHGTAIRIAATLLLHLPIHAARLFIQDNAAINIFERRGERYSLRLWNDTTHCPADAAGEE